MKALLSPWPGLAPCRIWTLALVVHTVLWPVHHDGTNFQQGLWCLFKRQLVVLVLAGLAVPVLRVHGGATSSELPVQAGRHLVETVLWSQLHAHAAVAGLFALHKRGCSWRARADGTAAASVVFGVA